MEDKMEDSTFTIDQITDLRLIEKARIKTGGPGLRTELQALITRLKSGGVGIKTDDLRETQAKRLYDKGFGGILSFQEYLTLIPVIPEALKVYNDRFPELALVDAHLPIAKICELLGIRVIDNGAHAHAYADFDPKTVKTDKFYWIRAQDGRKNNFKSVRACRKFCAKDEVGLSIYEGLVLFVQNPEGLKLRAMDLIGSIRRGCRDTAVYLSWFVCPELHWHPDRLEAANYGSATRLKAA
jgi:hypothetical protein